MIINTGQRTDIPAFYTKWFISRIKEGYVCVRNPYYPNLVTKFSLSPDVVDVIGFCTKNPRPMFKYLDILKPYGQFWYITITGFLKDIEPNVPNFNEVIEDFKYLSNIIGKNAIGIRYTPIIINKRYTKEYHVKMFEYIINQLKDYTSLVTFGFLDVYDKLKRKHPELKDCCDEDKIFITKHLYEISKNNNMDLRLCSKEKWLKDYVTQLDINGCMRLEDYEKAICCKLDVKQKMAARKGYRNCYLSNDIGAYNSCLHLCTYCYANGNKDLVMNNYRKHDINSPFIIGNYKENDIIKIAKQESYKIKS